MGIHDSLQTYSYRDSDARLQRYLDRTMDGAYRRADLLDPSRVPQFVKEVGDKLAPLTALPTTVGLHWGRWSSP